jgi:hypothetical protein
MKYQDNFQAFKGRQANWCERTGLRASRAMHTRALRWLNRQMLPDGFDHTGVYYVPTARTYILLTEPYHSVEPARQALQTQAGLAGGGVFCAVAGPANCGLWFPGPCKPLLVGPVDTKALLHRLAAALPSLDDDR